MKTIEERIQKRVETELGQEINDLFKPICDRMIAGSTRGNSVYDITLLDVAYNRNTIIQELQTLIFKQEIEDRIDAAITEFMSRAEGGLYNVQ